MFCIEGLGIEIILFQGSSQSRIRDQQFPLMTSNKTSLGSTTVINVHVTQACWSKLCFGANFHLVPLVKTHLPKQNLWGQNAPRDRLHPLWFQAPPPDPTYMENAKARKLPISCDMSNNHSLCCVSGLMLA